VGREDLCVLSARSSLAVHEELSALDEARNEAQYFRQARDAARQQLDHVERSRNAFKGELTKVRKTIHAGQCPWCRRPFKRLAAHMAAKHPDVDPEAEPT